MPDSVWPSLQPMGIYGAGASWKPALAAVCGGSFSLPPTSVPSPRRYARGQETAPRLGQGHTGACAYTLTHVCGCKTGCYQVPGPTVRLGSCWEQRQVAQGRGCRGGAWLGAF